MVEFDKFGKQYIEKRRRKSPVKSYNRLRFTYDAKFPQYVSKRPRKKGGLQNQEPITSRNGRFNFSLFSWVKKSAVIAGLIVLGFAGINWNGFAGGLMPQDLPAPPLDPVSPLVKFAAIQQAEYILASLEMPETVPENEIIHPIVLPETVIPVAVKTFSFSIHEVKKNENAFSIANKYKLRIDTVIAFNKLDNPSKLYIGQKLKIPNMDGIPYTIKSGDTVSSIVKKYNVKENALLDVNNIEDDRKIQAGLEIFLPGAKMNPDELNKALGIEKKSSKIFLRPVPGIITSNWGMREDPHKPGSGIMSFHYAIDYRGNIGDPVKAALAGTVSARQNNSLYGNFLIITHSDGYKTFYAHLSDYSVKLGDTVKEGQIIGKVGETGYVTGPHLHFAVYHNDKLVNPNPLIK